MSQYQNPYASPGLNPIAAAAQVDERVRFIRNTYLHLAGAVMALVLFELTMFNVFPGMVDNITGLIHKSGNIGWMVVLGLFMAASYIAEKWARSSTSKSTQYMGLGLYGLAFGIIVMPMLNVANTFYPGTIQSAGVVTGVVFVGLSAIVMLTKTDFSFMRYGLYLLGMAAMAAIVVSLFVGGDFLGTWFSWAMVVLMSGYILYHTSNIVHHYRTDQHVAAALALFSSVAMLFWYVLQTFMSRD